MKPQPPTAPSRYRVPNLERGLKLMELLLDFPNGLQQTEIAARLGCAKTSVYRIAMTLTDYGYLTRDEDTKTIRLSRKLVAMGSRTLAEEDLMTLSLDVLKNLRDQVKETVLIGAIVETELVVLGQVLGSQPFKFSVDLGTRLPLHSAAPAKAILAWMPPQERESLLGKISFTRFNDRTICDVKPYTQELRQAVVDGFAVDRGEQLSGIHCVAAPIFNRHGYPIAAVWITGPIDRVRPQDLPNVGALVAEHARIISERMGHGFLARNGKKTNIGMGAKDETKEEEGLRDA
jgi:DNA-binding IclR family transcriptional regulator